MTHRGLCLAAWLFFCAVHAVEYAGTQCVGIIDFELDVASVAEVESQIALGVRTAAVVMYLLDGNRWSLAHFCVVLVGLVCPPYSFPARNCVRDNSVDGDQLLGFPAHASLHARVQYNWRHFRWQRFLQEQL
jgi:hypothetical protein